MSSTDNHNPCPNRPPDHDALYFGLAHPVEIRKTRLLCIDGLRGIAAVAVTLFHLYNNSTQHEIMKASIPGWMHEVLTHGWLGVHVFFVISGFVILHSLFNHRLTWRFCGLFVLRRSVRLDPPYLATIALWIGITALSNVLLSHRELTYPSLAQLASHLVYLQHFLGFGDIVPVFWTLCFEIQFYLFLILLLPIGLRLLQKVRPNNSNNIRILFRLLTLLGLASMWQMFENYALAEWRPFNSPWAFKWWHMFYTGALVCAFRQRLVSRAHVALYMGVLVIGLGFDWHDDMAAAAVTGGFLLLANYKDTMSSWLSHAWIQYFGKISYSLYLLHFVIGCRGMNLIAHFSPDHVAYAWFAYGVGLGGAVVSSHLMYRFIEAPSVRLATRIKKAGLRPAQPAG